MKVQSLKQVFALPLALSLFSFAPLTAPAQDAPPKVLVIQREYLKPGKGGSLHEKTESAFIHAMTAAKSPSHYFSLASMSGPDRALFMLPYSSLADWERDSKATEKNKTLQAALDKAVIADGELLSEYSQAVYLHRDDLSLNEGGLLGKRYFEISRYDILPGHEKEFEGMVKIYVDGMKKAGNATNWATYEIVYGEATGDVFLALTTLKTLGDADTEIAEAKKFESAVGEEGMKKIRDITRSAVKSQQTNLFAISPKLSYPPDEWIKAEPDFWKSAAAPKPAAKPAP